MTCCHAILGALLMASFSVAAGMPPPSPQKELRAAPVCVSRFGCGIKLEVTSAAPIDDPGSRLGGLAPVNQHAAAEPLQAESKQARLFAAAARPRTPRIEERILPDGRRMTKVTGRHGSYCAYKESVNLTKGRDQLTAGVRTMMTSCP